MARTIDIAEARMQWNELLSDAFQGVEGVIVKDETHSVKLVLCETPPASEIPLPHKKRIAGLGEGEIWIREDFDDPLPTEFWFGSE